MFYSNDNHSPTGPLVVHHWAQAHNYTTRDWSSFPVTCWISDWPCAISCVEGKPLQVDMWGVVELLLVSYYIEKPRTLLPSTYLICFSFCLSVQRKIWQLLFISAFQISILLNYNIAEHLYPNRHRKESHFTSLLIFFFISQWATSQQESCWYSGQLSCHHQQHPRHCHKKQ